MERAKRLVRPWQVNTRPAGGHSTRERNDFYHTHRWRRVSEVYRANNTLCAQCSKEGRVTPSEVTDHIHPIHKDGDPWDTDNFQALCSECHNKKSAKEKGYVKGR